MLDDCPVTAVPRAYIIVGEYLRVTFLGKDDKTKTLLDELNKSMKNEQNYVLAVTYSSTKATEVIVGETGKTLEKTCGDVHKLVNTVEYLSATTKGSGRALKFSYCQHPTDAFWL
jgi:hypothetical protein